MRDQARLNPYLKGCLLYVACVVLVQFAYKVLPLPAVGLISAVREAVFQHMKAAFYACVLVSAIEIAVVHPRSRALIMSRAFSAVLFPWFIFLAWYIAPAVYGSMPSEFLEIVYANVALILAIAACVVAEQDLVHVPYSRGFAYVTAISFLVLILLFTVFTFRMPWADLFTVPPGWQGR